MTSSVTVRHNFETGHRLPHLSGKCENLHGHSWWAEVTITAPNEPGVVVEFGAFKKLLRGWIDATLDHGLMLGYEDPLVDVLSKHGKVFIFRSEHLDWPTVENVARLIGHIASGLLDEVEHADGAHVSHVTVSETHINQASWTP